MAFTKLTNEIKTILITGGTGLIGNSLSRRLTDKGYTVTHLSRNPIQKDYQIFYWDIKNKKIDDQAIISADAIIHLAGAGVSDKRWSNKYKKEIYTSRIDSTRLLKEKVALLNPNLKHFISASAIGYYGHNTGATQVDENSKQGQGFLASVVSEWEQEAMAFKNIEITVSMVRIGLVLSDKGGVLTKMMNPIKANLGACLGSGNQGMSWIHQNDLCNIFEHILEDKLEGIFNGVAPFPTTNKEFTKTVAKKLKKFLWLPKIPKFVLFLIFGKMAEILVGGNWVSSKKIEKTQFQFQYKTLEQALSHLLKDEIN